MSTGADSNPNWLELPRDVTSTILLKLGAIEILTSAQNVCSTWRNICKDPSMWRCIDTWNLDEGGDIEYDLEKICRHAVDRSSGDLVDINVESFATDDLLKYITDRSSRLMRLRLVSCHGISNEGLSEAVAKLPLLEELDLSYCLFSKEALEAVGRCSPLLKSFKLISWGYRHRQECNEEALAIAENMPGLRHLQICGNKLTDDGLLAILDGCPHLESLDLRQCFNCNLRGNLARACAERIKDLRSPTDYTMNLILKLPMMDHLMKTTPYLDFHLITHLDFLASSSCPMMMTTVLWAAAAAVTLTMIFIMIMVCSYTLRPLGEET